MRKYFAAFILLVLSIFVFPSVQLKFIVSGASTVPSGFEEQTVFSGLTNPTSVRFASDGRVFVAEKSGIIKIFDNTTDTTATTFADLRTNVHNFWDRGLLGLALDPAFPARPYVYVLYTYDAEIGGTAPRWGTAGATSDPCPSPPGATSDGCVVSARLSRLEAAGNTMTGNELVLINDWCQQYPSHSIGSLVFGQDGALYASAGDGSSFTFTDYGQDGNPLNPCGDPPGGAGAALTPPTAEGGSLRSQDLQTPADPTTLDGTIIRINPDTGEALPDNPNFGSSDPNARRIIAYGLRNPFRINRRPETNEIWLGDVGWDTDEEINRIVNPTDSLVENFGWPCYEGNDRQAGYDSANLNICETLYAQANAVIQPYYKYRHVDKVTPNETCPTGSSSLAGISFQFHPNAGPYPAKYDRALFFADYSRNCIWAMLKGTNGLPALASIETFVEGASGPVDIQFGPDGELYYADFNGGTIRRIHYIGALTPTPTPTPPPSCTTGQYFAEYFNNMTLTGTPVFTRCETAITNNWGAAGPGNGVNADGFSVRWTGSHNFNAGNYTFTATADDGVRAFLDATQIISGWIDQSATTYTDTRDVSAGSHTVKVEYYENGGDAVAQFGWVQNSQGGPVCPLGQYKAEYFNNMTLTGTPAVTRCETAINYDWGTASPATGVNNEHFSVRWTGNHSFASGSYLFTALTDDGMRAYIDSVNIIDAWIDQGATTYTSTRTLAAGDHEVKVEFYDNWVNATAHFNWQATNPPGNTPPVATITAPAASTTWKVGDTINFSGSGNDTEDGNIPASGLTWDLILHHCPTTCHTHTLQTFTGVSGGSFSAPDHDYPSHLELKLTATDSQGLSGTTNVLLYPQTVDLQFQTNPAGLQLTVGSTTAATPFTRTVIINSTNSLSASATQNLNGKTYQFTSWSDGGAATHNITATPTTTAYTATYNETAAATNGLSATYFNNMDFTGTTLVRTDPTIDYYWGAGSPDPAIGVDSFSARWTGQVEPQYSQTYTFYTYSDDGVRLWVNNQLVIDNWTDHSPTENAGTIALTANTKYDIKMEFYENGYDAVAKLSWSSASQPKQVIPQSRLYTVGQTPPGAGDGLAAAYFDNIDFTNLKINRTDPAVNFNWSGGSPDPTVGSNTFSARWTGFIKPKYSETYTFYTTTDDGVRLWVNNILLIDKWVNQSATEWSGTIQLAAGQKYPIKMEFYENNGSARAELRFSSASETKKIIPQTDLYTQ